MALFMIAIGVNGVTKAPEEILVGTMPWKGTKRVPLAYVEQNLDLDNIRVFNGQLVNKGTDYRRYTMYDTSTLSPINRSYYVLAKAENHKGKVYLVTDGLCVPIWLSIVEVRYTLMREGVRLSNVKMVETDTDCYLSGIKGEIQEVDYNLTCQQIRNYLLSVSGNKM